jgi:hypothetical protein
MIRVVVGGCVVLRGGPAAVINPQTLATRVCVARPGGSATPAYTIELPPSLAAASLYRASDQVGFGVVQAR